MSSTAVIVNPLTGQPLPQASAPGGALTRAPLGTAVLCGTLAGAVVVRVPLDPSEGSCFAVIDADDNAAAHAITVAGAGQLIDGAASLVLSDDGEFASFFYDRGQWRRLSPRRRLGDLGDPSAPLLELVGDQPPAASSVTSIGATAPIAVTPGQTPVVSIRAATNLLNGSMSAADKAKLDGLQKQGATTDILTDDLDWSLSGTYSKTLAAGANAMTFSNVTDGQLVIVRVDSDPGGSTLTWPLVLWSGGAAPVQTPTGSDVYTFVSLGGNIIGSVIPDVHF